MRAFNRVEEDGGGGQATMVESGGMPGYLCAASAAGEGCCYKPDTRSSSLTSTSTPASSLPARLSHPIIIDAVIMNGDEKYERSEMKLTKHSSMFRS